MADIRHPLALVVHGGAWTIPPEQQAAHQEGCKRAAEIGWAILVEGGSALDAVEAAIRVMEDDPTFDAGIGAVLTAEGTVELDAGLMDGESLRIGAVAALHHFRNPISIARRVLTATEHHLLVGAGAEQFAEAQGITRAPNAALIAPQQEAEFLRFLAGKVATADHFQSDTVGAVALDRQGHVAAGNSTGGIAFSLPGRVGDAPLPGVGFYADDRFGAVACTGWGEHIMRVGLALRVMQGLEEGLSALEAAHRAIHLLRARVQGKAGLIALTPDGKVGMAHSTRCLAHAYRTSAGAEIVSGVYAPAAP